MPSRIRDSFRPEKLKRTVIIIGIVFGLVESVVSRSPVVSLASVLSGAAVLSLFMYHLTHARGASHFTLDELLPDRRESKKLLAALLVFYAVMTPLLLPESIPGLSPQMTVWALYAVALVLLYFTLGRRATPAQRSSCPLTGLSAEESASRWRLWWLFIAVYSVVATTMSFGLQILSAVFTLSFHVAGVCFGLFIICATVASLLKRRGRFRDR